MKRVLFIILMTGMCVLGAADFEIVIPAKPFPAEQLAADELKFHLEKATGKTGAVVCKPSADAVLICRLGRAAGLPTAKLSPFSFILRTKGNEVLIAGKDNAMPLKYRNVRYGTLYGVYEYLRRQYGILFLWPGEYGTFFPANRKLEAGVYDLTWTPPLKHAAFRRFADWNRKVMRGCGPQLAAAGKHPGHAFGWWRDEFFADHPEWFAARDAAGKNRYLTYSSMCVSNPQFHDKIVELWSKTPGLAVNCRENDAYGNCACANCKAWDGEDFRWPSAYYQSVFNAGERYGRFYRAVFDKARKINPRAKLVAYAYMNYVYAPRKTRLHPDIVIGFVDDLPFPRSEKHQKLVNDEIDAWLASGVSLVWRPNFTLAGYAMPINYARQYAAQFKRMYRSGRLLGLDFDGPNLSWATLGFTYYTIARLTVEPDLNVDTIEKEYVSAFGAGADDVLAYLRYWEKYAADNAANINYIYENKSARRGFMYGFQDAAVAHLMYPANVFAPAEAILLRAAAKTAGDKDASGRVAFLLAGLRHARLCMETCAVFADPHKDNPARMKALEKVNAFRQNMPAGAADLAYYTTAGRLEANAWKFRSVDPASSIALPEMWNADIVMKKEELTEVTGKRQISTWQFVDDQIFGGSWNYCRYRCTVTVPEKWSKDRVILHLGAVDEECEVKVNGVFAGRFDYDPVRFPNSWNKPQEFDVTGFIRFGQSNSIEVIVHNTIRKGGLWRPSFLIFKPAYDGKMRSWDFAKGRQGWSLGGFKHTPGALRITAAPKLQPAKMTGLKYDFAPGGRKFEIGARVKANKFPSFLRLAIREVDANGRTIGYRPLELNPKPGSTDNAFRKESTVIRVRKQAVSIQLYIIPDFNIKNSGGSAEVTDIHIGALAR